MYNLILKDILIQKKFVLLSFLYIIFFIIIMQQAGFVIYPSALTALTYMFVVTSCAYDEKNKTDIMLNSLPLKRSNIVLAKYLTIFVYIAIGTAAYLITTTLISLTGLSVNVYSVSLEGLAGGLFAISFLNSIYFPFYFKFGYIKSRFINFILFFTFFFGVTSITQFLYRNRSTVWVQNIESFLKAQTDVQLFALIAGLALIMLAASFAFSLKAYQSRDLC